MFELDLDLAAALAAPRRCPRCASDRLAPVARDGVVTFRCQECRRTWACVLGILVRRTERIATDAAGADSPAGPVTP